MGADPSLSRRRQDQARKSVQLGKGRLWAAPSSNRADSQGCGERWSRSHRFVCLPDHVRLAVFPELGHVSTTTNLTMMSHKNQGLTGSVPSQLQHSSTQ